MEAKDSTVRMSRKVARRPGAGLRPHSLYMMKPAMIERRPRGELSLNGIVLIFILLSPLSRYYHVIIRLLSCYYLVVIM